MIYVMSDIHGNMRRFRSVMKKIKLLADDTLYVLGDVIDRHPDGIQILTELMEMKNVKMILGNHEYMMLDVLGTPYNEADLDECYNYERKLSRWYYNGGRITHEAIMRLPTVKCEEILCYLRSLPLNIKIQVAGQEYTLVHAAPVELYSQCGQGYDSPQQYALWKRWAITDPDLNDSILVFGHTTTRHFARHSPLQIWHAPNGKRIGIDCGSGYPNPCDDYHLLYNGRLGCLCLDDMKEFYSDEPK